MKIKTSELQGAALDWAVAKCEGAMAPTGNVLLIGGQLFIAIGGDIERCGRVEYSPSTDWSQGGPIIEQERISPAYEPSIVYDDSCRWKALGATSNGAHQYGPTPLIAAMRCYVAAKLGDEVEIPKELT